MQRQHVRLLAARLPPPPARRRSTPLLPSPATAAGDHADPATSRRRPSGGNLCDLMGSLCLPRGKSKRGSSPPRFAAAGNCTGCGTNPPAPTRFGQLHADTAPPAHLESPAAERHRLRSILLPSSPSLRRLRAARSHITRSRTRTTSRAPALATTSPSPPPPQARPTSSSPTRCRRRRRRCAPAALSPKAKACP